MYFSEKEKANFSLFSEDLSFVCNAQAVKYKTKRTTKSKQVKRTKRSIKSFKKPKKNNKKTKRR